MKIKLKEFCRAYGLFQTVLFAYGLNRALNPDIYERMYKLLIDPSFSLESKIALGVFTGIDLGLVLTGGVIGLVDGLTDMAKGTHHYFCLQLYKKLVKNEENKRMIENGINNQLSAIEKTVLSSD